MDTLTQILVSGAVVYAWLVWLFDGSVRQWLCAAFFPPRWLTVSRRQLATWSGTSFEAWLCLESPCPACVRKLLLCPYCCAFHVALWCRILTDVFGGDHPTHVQFWVIVFGSAGVAMFLKKIAK